MKINIYFWPRPSKAVPDSCTIHCRIFVDGDKANDFSTGVKGPLSRWDTRRKQFKGRQHQGENETLQIVREELTGLANGMRRDGAPLNAKLLHAAYIQKDRVSLRDYLWVFLAAVKGRSAPATERSYCSKIKNIDAYLREHPSDFDALGQHTADGMEKWLAAKGYKLSHASKHICLLKTIVKQAIRDGLIRQSPFLLAGYAKPKDTVPLFLTPEELAAIGACSFVSETLQRCADLFLFQAWTGMAYDDLARFAPDTHIKNMNGRDWVMYERGKTDAAAIVPLFQSAAAILLKYGWGLPPVMSNQKYNMYLKEVGALAGIQTKMTTHLARKSFGAVMLNNNFSIESVSRMLGHKNIHTTQRFYARVNVKRISDEMNGSSL